MKKKIMLAILVLATFAACKKNTEQQHEEKPPVKMKEITLSLAGLEVEESPLGRKAPDGKAYQRLLRDSTIYVVRAHFWGEQPNTYYGGAFTNPNNIKLMIPETGQAWIIVHAYKKGSGSGLHHTWVAGQPYFGLPINDTLQNRMEAFSGDWLHFCDTLSDFRITKPLDTLSFTEYSYPEIDAYRADTTFYVGNIGSQLVLSLKRTSSGLEFSSPQFTSGQLKVSFDGLMEPKVLTPANIAGSRFIFTNQLFRYDYDAYVPVKVVWEPGDGSEIVIGEKYVEFKKNTLTRIRVNLPDPVTGVVPVLTDTTWSGSENVDF